ncbi:hypothetical protein BB560_005202, partial [Smittium megazygosporum]
MKFLVNLKFDFGLLFMATTALSSIEPSLEIRGNNTSLSGCQRGTLVDASRFTRNCVLNRQSLTTSSKISCNTVFSSNIYCSETYVTIPCSTKYFYMSFNADINPKPNWWHVVASNGATVPNSNNIEYKFLLYDGFEIDTTTSKQLATRGQNLFTSGPQIPYGTNITYFVLHDENGSKMGMNVYISEFQSNIVPLNDILMKSPVNIALTADKQGIITLSNIQIRCLAQDTCTQIAAPPATSAVPKATSTTTVLATILTTVTQSTTNSSTLLSTVVQPKTIATTVTTTTTSPTTVLVSASPVVSTVNQTISTTVLSTVVKPTTIATTVTTTTTSPTTVLVSASPVVSTVNQTISTTVLSTVVKPTTIATTVTTTTTSPTTVLVSASPVVSTVNQTISTTVLSTVVKPTTIATTVTTTTTSPTTVLVSASPVVSTSLKAYKNYSKKDKINIPFSGGFTLSVTSNSIDSDLFFGFADANGVAKNDKYIELQIGLKNGQNSIKDLVAAQIRRRLFKRGKIAK